MDVLSEVLKAAKLDGSMFYNAEYSAPWCFRASAAGTLTNSGTIARLARTHRQGTKLT
jgi:hypothetical protein